jgi:tetrahydromethanopterin S-methyltransferase subunit D
VTVAPIRASGRDRSERSPSWRAVLALQSVLDRRVAKITNLDNGTALIAAGLGFLAAAAVAATTLPYPANLIAGALIAATAMSLIIAGTLLLYDANDPPIPDFREREPVLVDPRAWSIPEPDDDSLHALHTLALLVARVVSARV